MTEQQPPEPHHPPDPPPERPETIVVPGRRARGEPHDELEPETVIIEARDVGSASRSCLAIVAALIFIAILLCIYFTAQLFT